ncbi:hypothetical protein [Sphingomonas rhizophila]
MNPLFGILGIVAILAVAFLLSTNRKAIRRGSSAPLSRCRR